MYLPVAIVYSRDDLLKESPSIWFRAFTPLDCKSIHNYVHEILSGQDLIKYTTSSKVTSIVQLTLYASQSDYQCNLGSTSTQQEIWVRIIVTCLIWFLRSFSSMIDLWLCAYRNVSV